MRPEIRDELFEAVFAGDLARAEAALNDAHSDGPDRLSEDIRRAKQRARPELRQETRSGRIEVFPRPGHAPGSTEYDFIPITHYNREAG